MGVLQAITARDLGILLRKILVYTEKNGKYNTGNGAVMTRSCPKNVNIQIWKDGAKAPIVPPPLLCT